MEPLCEIRRQSAIEELRTAGWVKHLQWPHEVDSTNNMAKLYIQDCESKLQCNDLPPYIPALFVADRQTAGRGRSGNAWWSPDGCLMFTLAIGPSELPDAPDRLPQLALVTGLALAETVDQFLGSEKSQLKWPNDVYVAERKLAGILIESLSSRMQSLVFAVGIGINTDMDWRTAPASIQQQAICLSSAAQERIYRESVLVEFIPRFAEHLRAWCDEGDYWQTAWQDRNLLRGRIVTLRAGEAEVTGLCEGIDSAGRLLLRTERELLQISAGSILDWQ